MASEVGYPIIVRPAFILGGSGTGIAHNLEEMRQIAARGLAASPISEILIERSVLGWKEFELEVMRDHADNVVVVCSIENVDAMGVHTGESITVAPAQTLTDVEYQEMRDAVFACIRRIGVETGGSNVQFAVNPDTGEQVIIEMNPRVSRSSALASKATGFPIAKIAAKLAVGYRLDEVQNDITRETPASFEPTIDYVVTKIPRWAFEKLPGASPVLGTQMQSVGEVMAIGRTFTESLQKALRSLEIGRAGLNCDWREHQLDALSADELVQAAAVPTPDRVFQLEAALRKFVSVERLHDVTGIDPWFLDQLLQIVEERERLANLGLDAMTRADWRRAKRHGFSDAQLAYLFFPGAPGGEEEVRQRRLGEGVRATFKTVDTCAAEFAAFTPYHYGTYEDDDEIAPLTRAAVVILGKRAESHRAGRRVRLLLRARRIRAARRGVRDGHGQLQSRDRLDRLRHQRPPVLRAAHRRGRSQCLRCPLGRGHGRAGELRGVIVSLGGQTPLKLAGALQRAGIPILGTSPVSIDAAEDREQFNALCERLGIPQPPGGTATTAEDAVVIANEIGYPVLVRPSYVLGGRAMEIVYDDVDLRRAMAELAHSGSLGREGGLSSERPALVDRFLEDAVEVDVDAIRDRTGDFIVGGIMEHIEEAGVHSGDSACAIPPPTLAADALQTIARHTHELADALEVVGLLNVQYAVKDGRVFVLEANPRASRTVPFVSKATGVQLAKVAARVMVGATLEELRAEGLLRPPAEGGHVSVKEAVLPFNRFPDVDTILGPEMRSTGEVMGIDRTFGMAFSKSQAGAGNTLPSGGTVFMTLADRDKNAGLVAARRFVELGFLIVATAGTADTLEANGIGVDAVVAKVGEDVGVDALDLISSGKVDLVVNTPRGRGPRSDGMHIRRAAIVHGVPCVTTVPAAIAAAAGIAEAATREPEVRSLQQYHLDGQLRLEV